MPVKPGYVRKPDFRRGAVEMIHGSGGRATADLIHALFAAHFSNEWLDQGHDGAVMPPILHAVAVSCDAHVVKPLFFPGGDIGRLAICGTVNDVAMCGAKPLYIAASFILEEGFPFADLERIVASMAEAAKEAGVAIVTGDTKVVERGKGDGVYISTAGVGEKLVEQAISGKAARPGDKILVSGNMGEHGMTIMSLRENMTFGTNLKSDCAPLADMVESILKAAPNAHVLRDPTRGGLATTLNEIATESGVGMNLEEASVPVSDEVRAAYHGRDFTFGPEYIIPMPLDPRIIEWVAPAVAQAAVDSGVARGSMEDIGGSVEAYRLMLRERMKKAKARTASYWKSYEN